MVGHIPLIGCDARPLSEGIGALNIACVACSNGKTLIFEGDADCLTNSASAPSYNCDACHISLLL